MIREVKWYVGEMISEEPITKMCNIAKEAKRIKDLYCILTNKRVSNFKSLCCWYDSEPNELRLFLGEDWFILYRLGEETLEVLEWHATDNHENKMKQTAEMIMAMKEVLLQGVGITITASMRRKTSYKFYLTLRDVGYVKEDFNYGNIVYPCPVEAEKIYNDLRKQYCYLPDELTEEEKKRLAPYGDYIVHDVEFSVTDKFVKKYGKRQI